MIDVAATGTRKCPQCGSLNTYRDGRARRCFDCRAISNGREVVIPGSLEAYHSLEVQDSNGRTLWADSLRVLFEAQCDIAAGLGIPPGIGLSNWLRARQRRPGIIDDRDTLRRMSVISQKIVYHAEFVRASYNVRSAERLSQALPRASRMVLTTRSR